MADQPKWTPSPELIEAIAKIKAEEAAKKKANIAADIFEKAKIEPVFPAQDWYDFLNKEVNWIEEGGVRVMNGLRGNTPKAVGDIEGSILRRRALARKVGIGLVVGAGAVWAWNRISGKDDDYNVISGMRHGGYAGSLRRYNTDFGSGYRGPRVSGQYIDPQVQQFREKYYDTQTGKDRLQARLDALRSVNNYGVLDPSELTPISSKKSLVDASNYNLEWEDADTLLLKQKGLMSFWKKDIAIRLTGIDAPEVAHPGDPTEWFRFHQEQPHGRLSVEQVKAMSEGYPLRIEVASDPVQKTYGRYLGLIYRGDETTSINEMEVQQGIAAALPYGESGSDIYSRTRFIQEEKEAIADKRGIWALPFYQKYLEVSQGMGGRLTFNTLTDLTRLAKNYHLAAAEKYIEDDSQAPHGYGRYLGQKLIPSYGRFFSGQGKSYNIIEGLKHGGEAQKSRRAHTDFGSGFDRVRWFAKQAGKTFEAYTGSKVFREALSKGKVIRELGRGKFGIAELMETELEGKAFQFVRKTAFSEEQLAKSGIAEMIAFEGQSLGFSMHRASLPGREASAMRKLGTSEYVPSLYREHGKQIYQEYMPGMTLKEAARQGVLPSKEAEQQFLRFVSGLERQGIQNVDIHSSNILFDINSERLSWIDWGAATKAEHGANLYSKKATERLFERMRKNVAVGQEATALGSVTELDIGETLLQGQVVETTKLQKPKKVSGPVVPVSSSRLREKQLIMSEVLKENQRSLSEAAVYGGKGHVKMGNRNIPK